MRLSKWKIIILMVCICFLQGCSQVDISVSEKISPPAIKQAPIQGTWKVEKYALVNEQKGPSSSMEKYVGQIAAFDKNAVVFGDEICKMPEYKVKNVSADEYFLYGYKTNTKGLGIDNKNIDIIAITSDQEPFKEFVKIDDNNLLVYENQGFLYLKKTSDTVDEKIIEYVESLDNIKNAKNTINDDTLLRSGVLLGLKLSKAADGEGNSYRTLWIASNNKELRPILEMQQLLVPRTNGFWEVGYNFDSKSHPEGNLYARTLLDYNNEYVTDDINTLSDYDGVRDITFVGNDFIGTEYKGVDENTLKSKAQYQVLRIDNIASGKGINISEAAGKNGTNAFVRSSQVFISSLDETKQGALDNNPREDNFTLVRQSGHWALKGRINYINPTPEKRYEDFNIFLIPPSKLISYDNLCLAWNEVEKKVPDATDVFTSPNKDIAIVLTKGSIQIFAIENNSLSEKPLRIIKIPEGETAVMAEWAIGDYMKKWEDFVASRTIKLVQ